MVEELRVLVAPITHLVAVVALAARLCLIALLYYKVEVAVAEDPVVIK